MTYYKITSLTPKLGKRHIDKNTTLNISYREGFNTREHNLAAGATLYISSPSLPVNLHKLRMKNLISVVEIGKNLFLKLTKPKPVVEKTIVPAPLIAEKLVSVLPIAKPMVEKVEPKKEKRTYKKKEEIL